MKLHAMLGANSSSSKLDRVDRPRFTLKAEQQPASAQWDNKRSPLNAHRLPLRPSAGLGGIEKSPPCADDALAAEQDRWRCRQIDMAPAPRV